MAFTMVCRPDTRSTAAYPRSVESDWFIVRYFGPLGPRVLPVLPTQGLSLSMLLMAEDDRA